MIVNPVTARAAEVRMMPVATTRKPVSNVIATENEAAKLLMVRSSLEEVVRMVIFDWYGCHDG